MSDDTEKTEPKELARQARLLLTSAKALKLLLDEVKAPELCGFRYQTSNVIDDMIKAALTCPGLRVAVFPENEQEVK